MAAPLTARKKLAAVKDTSVLATTAAKQMVFGGAICVGGVAGILYWMFEGNPSMQRRKTVPRIASDVQNGVMMPPPKTEAVTDVQKQWLAKRGDGEGARHSAVRLLVGPHASGKTAALLAAPEVLSQRNCVYVSVDPSKESVVDAVFKRLIKGVPRDRVCLGGNFRYPVVQKSEKLDYMHEIWESAKLGGGDATEQLPAVLLDVVQDSATAATSAFDVSAVVEDALEVSKQGLRCTVYAAAPWNASTASLLQVAMPRTEVVFVPEPSVASVREYVLQNVDPSSLPQPSDVDKLIAASPRVYGSAAAVTDYLSSSSATTTTVTDFVKERVASHRDGIRTAFDTACGVNARTAIDQLLRDGRVRHDVLRQKCTSSDLLFDKAILAPVGFDQKAQTPLLSWQHDCWLTAVKTADSAYLRSFGRR